MHLPRALLATLVLSACADRPPAIVACPAPEASRPGTLSVTASATLDVVPDCADLTMKLSADAATPGAATAAVTAEQNALVAAISKLNVDNPTLKLSQLVLEPVYEPAADGARLKVHAYRADITITATTHNLVAVGPLMSVAADAGASELTTAFRADDLPKLKQRVRDMAIAAVKAKANQTATGLGVTLGRVLSVSESASDSPPGAYTWANAAQTARGGGGGLGAQAQPLTLELTVGYELAGGKA